MSLPFRPLKKLSFATDYSRAIAPLSYVCIMMVKKKSKIGRRYKAGTGNSIRSRELIAAQHVASSTPNNPLTGSTAPLVVTSSAPPARMPPPVQKFADHQHALNNQASE